MSKKLTKEVNRVLPILFHTEMVRAILDGKKTCTRRVVKPQPDERHSFPLGFVIDSSEKKDIGKFGFGVNEYGCSMQYAKPPYLPGDVLYVRETFQCLYNLDGNEQIVEDTEKYYYAATDTLPFTEYVDSKGVTHDFIPWRPSIHMPKEAARIWLKVIDVKVERLQDITEEQARKEGVSSPYSYADNDEYWEITGRNELPADIAAFFVLWDSTIKKSNLNTYGWDANPWVWVIEFERCEKPEE